ncbi:MAG: alanine--glyoxylate aminotransferase family protein [Planctomycetota bacterium]|nr:MAG: alanine--glyoxylate aminotransferase family protein [Planctomycetota bacterium]
MSDPIAASDPPQGAARSEIEVPGVRPPRRVLMGPGPSDVPDEVLAALSRTTIGHLDPEFLRIMDELQQMLRAVFRTRNELTLAVSGTGSAGMETCVVNLIEPGDRMLVCISGVFGRRMADVARRAGADVRTIERPFGEVFTLEEIERAAREHAPKVVGIVHAETSTGAHQPLQNLADIVHQAGALLLVDCVTSLGGMPVEVDAWGLDAVYSGTQKCLSCPPGLAPVTFSPRAVEVIETRRTPVQSWYLDLTMVRQYWGGERTYHHTAPINMNYALHEALRLVLAEGLESRWRRHTTNHRALRAGLEAMGLRFFVAAEHRLPMLNAVWVPEGCDEAAVRRQLLRDFGIEIGAGLGPVKGKVWRIGLMGASCCPRNVLLLLAALEQCLKRQGLDVESGAATAAAADAYGNTD